MAGSDLIGDRRQKIYRGAYSYLRNGKPYCEETFDVFRDHKEMTVDFNAQLFSRVPTGELMRIKLEYRVDNKYNPVSVSIEKSLGSELSKETYECTSRTNIMIYKFTNNVGNVTEYKMNTPPKFHITTPFACTSCLFLLSKKIEGLGKSFFTVIGNYNRWRYSTDLHSTSILAQKLKLEENESLVIGGKKLISELFHICEDDMNRSGDTYLSLPFIRAYISQHMSIPYMLVEESTKTTIQVKYFNSFET